MKNNILLKMFLYSGGLSVLAADFIPDNIARAMYPGNTPPQMGNPAARPVVNDERQLAEIRDVIAQLDVIVSRDATTGASRNFIAALNARLPEWERVTFASVQEMGSPAFFKLGVGHIANTHNGILQDLFSPGAIGAIEGMLATEGFLSGGDYAEIYAKIVKTLNESVYLLKNRLMCAGCCLTGLALCQSLKSCLEAVAVGIEYGCGDDQVEIEQASDFLDEVCGMTGRRLNVSDAAHAIGGFSYFITDSIDTMGSALQSMRASRRQ
ncbi:MAG: hypothetical protein LBJ96_06180 [Holosporaceae bacterium]|jgi:hypothetical protein|nr:hypothetical protein [Holosporaceae bacterium]